MEKADGLDDIFRKYMEKRTGQYLVFCANKEHMDEMIALAPEWFAKVDGKSRFYSAYSDDPKISRVFYSIQGRQQQSSKAAVLH